jgi:branched-subunit amino acid ABC-type transport system permease component
MIQFLQISISLIFFANKTLVLIDKKTGWLIGAIGAIMGTLYFFLLHLYCFSVLDMGLVILMGYGFIVKSRKNQKVENFIHIVIASAILALGYFAFSGLMTVVEFFSSILLLLGTYFLTHQKTSWGWILYAISHILAAIVGYKVGQMFFADFQIASAIVSIAGLIKARKLIGSLK